MKIRNVSVSNCNNFKEIEIEFNETSSLTLTVSDKDEIDVDSLDELIKVIFNATELI